MKLFSVSIEFFLRPMSRISPVWCPSNALGIFTALVTFRLIAARLSFEEVSSMRTGV